MEATQILSVTKSLARTALVSMKRGSDVKRWRNDSELSPEWFSRSIIAAKHIEPETSVIEFGAGAGRLRELLPSDCFYQPTDLVQRAPGYMKVDLNAAQPLPCGYDVAVLLGVLEYLHDPEAVFRRLRGVAGRLIFSYCLPGPEINRMRRRSRGWVNDMSEKRLLAACKGGGFAIDSIDELMPGHTEPQLLVTCRSV